MKKPPGVAETPAAANESTNSMLPTIRFPFNRSSRAGKGGGARHGLQLAV
jgi:hypothetical protein